MTWSFLVLLIVVVANGSLLVSTQNLESTQDAESPLVIRSLIAYAGDTVVVPCPQTSPEQRVELMINDELKEVGDRISFDPKVGFSLKNVSALDTGVYNCTIVNLSNTSFSPQNNETTIYNVQIFTTSVLQNLMIESDNTHVTKGSELNLKCTVEIDIDMPYSFNWTIPRETAVKKEIDLPAQNNGRTRLQSVSSVLNIQNVTSDDEGEYFCQVTTFAVRAKIHAHVKIYDP